MQQRVALARALAAEPPLLLLDEPLSALDAAIRDELRTELRRLQRQLDLTVIYVTHDQAEAMAISDRIVVMERGKVNQVGSPAGALRPPGHPLRRRFHRRQQPPPDHDRDHRRPARRPLGRRPPARRPQRPASPGSSVMAAWRPEAAALLNAADAAPSALHGRIELITFLGPITRLDISVPGDEEPVLVDLVSSAAAHLETGQPIAVSVPPDAIRIYA